MCAEGQEHGKGQGQGQGQGQGKDESCTNDEISSIEIPIIDISGLRNGNNLVKHTLAKRIGQACHDIGYVTTLSFYHSIFEVFFLIWVLCFMFYTLYIVYLYIIYIHTWVWKYTTCHAFTPLHLYINIRFFVITNHGINQSVIDNIWDTTTAFFDLSSDEKMALSPEDQATYPYGYNRMGGEILSAGKDAENGNEKKSLPDLKESFSLGPGNPDSVVHYDYY